MIIQVGNHGLHRYQLSCNKQANNLPPVLRSGAGAKGPKLNCLLKPETKL